MEWALQVAPGWQCGGHRTGGGRLLCSVARVAGMASRGSRRRGMHLRPVPSGGRLRQSSCLAVCAHGQRESVCWLTQCRDSTRLHRDDLGDGTRVLGLTRHSHYCNPLTPIEQSRHSPVQRHETDPARVVTRVTRVTTLASQHKQTRRCPVFHSPRGTLTSPSGSGPRIASGNNTFAQPSFPLGHALSEPPTGADRVSGVTVTVTRHTHHHITTCTRQSPPL